MTQNGIMSEDYVHIEREDGEWEDLLISKLTYVALDRGGDGRAFSEKRFIGRISNYDIEKVKTRRSEIIHPSDYRLCDWLTKTRKAKH